MKSVKVLLTLFLYAVSPVAFSQVKNFTVSGDVKGLDVKYLYFYQKDDSRPGGYFKDSVPVNNGSFTYSMSVKEPTYMTIYPGVERVVKAVKGGGFYPTASSLFQLIAVPGGRIYLSGQITDFVDAYPFGDPANNDLARLNRMVCPLMNQSVNLQLKIANKETADSAEIKEINTTMDQLNREVIRIKENFIRENLSSVVSVWLLSDMMIRSEIPNDRAMELFKKLNKESVEGYPLYAEVSKRVDGILATAIGNKVPAINSMNTYNGKRFDLASLKGKYVIIDFWGTWCGACVSGMPKMKEYLDKYKNKLDIVGVAQESDNGDRWRKFLNKNTAYNWHQVLSRPDEDYILKFSVAGFPTKIIVDPKGKILARYVGEDEGFYEKLDGLLK